MWSEFMVETLGSGVASGDDARRNETSLGQPVEIRPACTSLSWRGKSFRRNQPNGDHMKYMLLIFANEAGQQGASQVEMGQMMAAYGAYTEALKQAGVLAGGDRLQPTASATTVRVAGGKTEVLNGPYAETKEQLGGYYLIDVPDLDVALSWAARCPGASHGTIEVRPLWSM
jgi:hypothetical protein